MRVAPSILVKPSTNFDAVEGMSFSKDITKKNIKKYLYKIMFFK